VPQNDGEGHRYVEGLVEGSGGYRRRHAPRRGTIGAFRGRRTRSLGGPLRRSADHRRTPRASPQDAFVGRAAAAGRHWPRPGL